jgi:hypothetical protein
MACVCYTYMVQPHASIDVGVRSICVFETRDHFENGTLFAWLLNSVSAIPEHPRFTSDGLYHHIWDIVGTISVCNSAYIIV